MELKKLAEIQNRIDKINTENAGRGIPVYLDAYTNESVVLRTTDNLEYHDTVSLINIFVSIGYGKHGFIMDIASVPFFLDGYELLKTPADFAERFKLKK